MKVLLFDTTNAWLTPGGKTTHALKLQKEISRLGVDIQFARWWDETQKDVDLIHFLSPSSIPARLAKEHGIKTFFSMIFDYETNKSAFAMRSAMLKTRLLTNLPFGLSRRFGYWNALPFMDRIQFMHTYDRDTALKYFPKHIDRSKTLIIPHAYDPNDMFISDEIDIRNMGYPDKYLVSCANISERKQTVLLARLAKKSGTPIVFIGSHAETDPYFNKFKQEIDNRYVFYPGYVSKEWKDCIVRNASGYVLLSKGESGCIAVYEAAAYKIPLLLSNLPWAWGYAQPTDISLCDWWDGDKAICQLRNFYASARHLDHKPFFAHTWAEIAATYVAEYKKLVD